MYLWTKLQNARREGESLAYRILASSSSSKHLAASEEIRVAYYNISKYVGQFVMIGVAIKPITDILLLTSVQQLNFKM